MSANDLGFPGCTSDPVRNALQSEFANNIGNRQTASRSIECAVKIETYLFDRCESSTCEAYVNGSASLLQNLRGGNAGLFVQQKLLQGDMPPEKWVETALPDLGGKKSKKAAPKQPSSSSASSVTTTSSSPSAANADSSSSTGGKEEKMMTSNPYYFGRKLTSEEEAKRFKPKKLDASELATKAPAEHEEMGFSAFNAARTWEERDLTSIAKELLEKRYSECELKTPGLTLTSTSWTITGDYAVALGKSGKTASFEFKCKCELKGTFVEGEDEVDVTGTLGEFMLDDVDGEDMDYDIQVDITKPSKNDKRNHHIRSLLRAEIIKIKQVGKAFIEEMLDTHVNKK